MPDTPEPQTPTHKRYTAVWVLGALFLAVWAGQAVLCYFDTWEEANDHQQPFEWSSYWLNFWIRTAENWQSEILQIMVAAWVFKHFLWTGSPESKDSQG